MCSPLATLYATTSAVRHAWAPLTPPPFSPRAAAADSISSWFPTQGLPQVAPQRRG